MINLELTKLRILFERAEREHQEAKKYLEPVMEDIRLRLHDEHEKVIKAFSEYHQAGLEANWCVFCKDSLDKCGGHPASAI